MMKFHTLALAAAVAIMPVAAAQAATVELKYDDLDLSTAKGQAELSKRVDDAARQACSADSVRTGTILRSKAENQCYRETRTKLRERFSFLSQQEQRG
jgi:UrcA family protein